MDYEVELNRNSNMCKKRHRLIPDGSVLKGKKRDCSDEEAGP